jgi:hypothetical protein
MTSTSSTGMAERNIDAAFDLLRQIIDDPNVLDTIPDGATIVFIPNDDPAAAASNLELGISAVRSGTDVYFRHVESLDTPD